MKNEILEKVLKNGSKMRINMASFQEAMSLFKTISSILGDVDFENVDTTQFVFKMAADSRIEAALWPCMARGEIDGRRINQDLFESVEYRGVFLEVAREVVIYNIAPFFEGLGLSSLIGSAEGNIERQNIEPT